MGFNLEFKGLIWCQIVEESIYKAQCTGLFKMTVGVLTTCHTQFTSDSSICIFLFNRTTLQVFATYLTGMLQKLGGMYLSDLLHLLFCHWRPTSAFPSIHAPCLLKLWVPFSNGIVRWLFPEFGAELPLENCNWPTFMKCKHTIRLLTAVHRHLSKLRSKRTNA